MRLLYEKTNKIKARQRGMQAKPADKRTSLAAKMFSTNNLASNFTAIYVAECFLFVIES